MAVVLPIHSHIDFSGPMDKDYESPCPNEEEEEETRINENESQQEEEEEEEQQQSSSDLFPNLEDENNHEDSDNYEDNTDVTDDNPMDIGESSDDCEEKSTTSTASLPLNESDPNADEIDCIQNDSDSNCNAEENVESSNSVDNYWAMENDESREKTMQESETAVDDDNSAFISSLMAVDLACTSTTNHNDESSEDPLKDPSQPTVSNIVDAILMDETDAPNEEDQESDNNMQVDFNEATTTTPNTTTGALTAPAIVEEATPAPEPSMYGGLENLGNTCYMASAIQLLCGLDSFPADLKGKTPAFVENKTEENDNVNINNTKSLRDALVDVMDRLGKGETLRPDELKRCIDSRTSLFLGYHQQDSHEFLTTLLDIIDEDYKRKPKPEEPTATTTSLSAEKESNDTLCNEDEDENDGDKELANDAIAEQQSPNNERESTPEDCNDDENDCDANDNDNDNAMDSGESSLESALKRQKVVEEQTTPVAPETVTESTAVDPRKDGEEAAEAAHIPRSKSYSQFQFADIESLLHTNGGDGTTSTTAAPTLAAATTDTKTMTAAKQEEPKCKLAGGRMSTAGVELTRFVEESGMDEDVRPTGASLENATPQQQIVEEEHHDTTQEEEETEESTTTACCSPVSSNFTTKVRVCLTCESCKFRRSHVETYFHLSLDISTDASNNDNETNNNHCDDGDVLNVGTLGCPSSSSIEDGLRKFFAPEKRQIKCEKCFHTSALQTSEITQLPRNLLFHLKRFIVDVSPDYSSISYRKDQSPVIFDERMELEANDDDNEEENHEENRSRAFRNVHDDEERGFKDFLALDCSYEKGAAYELRSVVNHIGSSASCGHYTADAKRLPFAPDAAHESETEKVTTDHREWIRFNDSYVSKISSKEAVEDASQTAYMIMYELVH